MNQAQLDRATGVLPRTRRSFPDTPNNRYGYRMSIWMAKAPSVQSRPVTQKGVDRLPLWRRSTKNRRRGMTGTALLAGMILALPGPASAKMMPLDRSSYSCVQEAADAPKPPPLPPTAAQDRRAAGLEDAKPLCPDGQVPIPRYTAKQKATLAQLKQVPPAIPRQANQQKRGGATILGGPPNSSVSPTCVLYFSTSHYCHHIASQVFSIGENTTSLFAALSVHAPTTATTIGDHSIAQVWGVLDHAPGLTTSLEAGWRVSPAGYAGLPYPSFPHLFAYRNQPSDTSTCYPYLAPVGDPCDFVPTGGTPILVNQAISPDGAISSYGVSRSGTNWFFYYGGYFFGSMPASSFYSFPWQLNRIDVGGEVVAPGPSTCTDMGNGTWGSLGGALVQGAYRIYGPTGTATAFLNPSLSTGQWYQEGIAYNIGYNDDPNGTFRYGGPGWC